MRPTPTTPTVTPNVLSVRMPQKSLYVVKGKKVKMPVAAYTEKNEKVALKWESTNKSKATVTQKGYIKGIKPGSVKIIAKASNGKKATLKVFVVKKAKMVKNIVFAKKTTKAMKNKTVKFLNAFIRPKNATGKRGAVFNWKSSNRKIARVDAVGRITALKKGKCKITVTVGGRKKTFVLRVK